MDMGFPFGMMRAAQPVIIPKPFNYTLQVGELNRMQIISLKKKKKLSFPNSLIISITFSNP